MNEEVLRDSFSRYPKLWALGHGAISRIFHEGDVIIEEKIDGSQFSFGVIRGELKCRSKSVALNMIAPDKMFINAVESAKQLENLLHPEWTYRCEYLKVPKHNTLAYERIPNMHLIGFDISTDYEELLSDDEKREEFERIGLEIVPRLFKGKIENPNDLRVMLDNISILGGQLIEGVVVKNFTLRTPLGQIAMGKFVSEDFKEIHQADWKERGNDKKDFIENLITCYRTPARWNKAIQHLKESGKLENDPRDIGSLMKEVPADILSECKEQIQDNLFEFYWPHIARGVCYGLPQWYKEELLKKSFNQ